MSDERTTRIEEVLAGVRDEVASRRANRRYGEGYEEAVESAHAAELGKIVPVVDRPDLDELLRLLAVLREDIEAIREVERDPSRFTPVRYVRELAMSRHQLVRLAADVKGIAESIESIARHIVDTERERSESVESVAREALNAVLERTAVLERLAGAYDELDKRLEHLEKNTPS